MLRYSKSLRNHVRTTRRIIQMWRAKEHKGGMQYQCCWTCVSGLQATGRVASDRPMFQHVVAALEYLSAFYDTVLTHGCFLPAADGRRAKTGLERYLVHYQYLTNLFLNSDPRRRLFYITEKRNHYPWHIAQACEYYNPKQGWTYQDEDFMGKMSQLAASVVRGLGPCRLGPALMWKYRNRVHIRYNRRRRAASLDL